MASTCTQPFSTERPDTCTRQHGQRNDDSWLRTATNNASMEQDFTTNTSPLKHQIVLGAVAFIRHGKLFGWPNPHIPHLIQHTFTCSTLFTSLHFYIFYIICKYSQLHMSVKHDHEHERTEHMMPRLQQPHQRTVGALPQSRPGLCGTLVDLGKDTNGTPVFLRRKAVGVHETTNDNKTKADLE